AGNIEHDDFDALESLRQRLEQFEIRTNAVEYEQRRSLPAFHAHAQRVPVDIDKADRGTRFDGHSSPVPATHRTVARCPVRAIARRKQDLRSHTEHCASPLREGARETAGAEKLGLVV